MAVEVRLMRESDIDQTWPLMRDLAIFEDYIDSFAITPEIVRERGIKKDPPDFYCLVADVDGKIAGMLVYYFMKYTAQNKPSIFMKELYVEEEYRNQKIGEQLMKTLYSIAKENGCGLIKWTVADWNHDGQRFYKRLGAEEDRVWLNYSWSIK
ncbi:MAG: N-acetyltransferase family protein [Dialister pneumosintes]|jgi:Acetyltransferases